MNLTGDLPLVYFSLEPGTYLTELLGKKAYLDE